MWSPEGDGEHQDQSLNKPCFPVCHLSPLLKTKTGGSGVLLSLYGRGPIWKSNGFYTYIQSTRSGVGSEWL